MKAYIASAILGAIAAATDPLESNWTPPEYIPDRVAAPDLTKADLPKEVKAYDDSKETTATLRRFPSGYDTSASNSKYSAGCLETDGKKFSMTYELYKEDGGNGWDWSQLYMDIDGEFSNTFAEMWGCSFHETSDLSYWPEALQLVCAAYRFNNVPTEDGT